MHLWDCELKTDYKDKFYVYLPQLKIKFKKWISKTLKTNKQRPMKIPSSIYHKDFDCIFKVIFQYHLDLGNFYL